MSARLDITSRVYLYTLCIPFTKLTSSPAATSTLTRYHIDVTSHNAGSGKLRNGTLIVTKIRTERFAFTSALWQDVHGTCMASKAASPDGWTMRRDISSHTRAMESQCYERIVKEDCGGCRDGW
jgi:hypothetical protein